MIGTIVVGLLLTFVLLGGGYAALRDVFRRPTNDPGAQQRRNYPPLRSHEDAFHRERKAQQGRR